MRRILALVVTLALLCAAPSVAWAAGGAQDISADQIDQYLQKAMQAGKIPGLSVAIIQGQEVVYLKGFGSAGGGRPVTPQTPFTVCSVGKTFTALAVRQLVQQGKLSYDSPVQAYIPWFTLAEPDAAAKITIGDLINHKSGLSTASGTAGYTYDTKLTLDALVRSLKNVKPDRPVGQTEEYCNLNFIILGFLVEQVSGMSYGEYVQKNILEPMGMTNSFTNEGGPWRHGSSSGHSVAFGLAVPTNIPFPPAQMPAGYQLSSAEDMAKFAQLWMSNGYVGGQSLIENNPLAQRQPTDKVDALHPRRYSVYWMPEDTMTSGYMGYEGHEGGSANFSTMLLFNPVTMTAIVVLTNCANGSHNPVLSAATIARDLSAYLANGIQLPQPAAGFGDQWIYFVALGVVVLLLALRAFWVSRFSRNLGRGGRRKACALASYALLDGALPLAVLVVLPAAFRASWPFLINVNFQIACLILLAAIGLLVVFLAKTHMLIRSIRARKPVQAA